MIIVNFIIRASFPITHDEFLKELITQCESD